MSKSLPPVADTVVWDAWLSLYKAPCITVALESGIFEYLANTPSTLEELAQNMSFNLRATRAILPILLQLGFLEMHGEVYRLSLAGKHYMLKSSDFFWGDFFSRLSDRTNAHAMLMETLNDTRQKDGERPADGWESGHLDLETARKVTGFMHCHSLAAAVGMSQSYDFTGVERFLDVGGGSGCFAIAVADQHPQIHCTVMDLVNICKVSEEYITNAGVQDRVTTQAIDMFREAWPQDHDVHFFSNIFHDWTIETCHELAAASYQHLPSGGRIMLHEMLLDDKGTGPEPAALFSVLMAAGTMGQQFTLAQLTEILEAAGFQDICWEPGYGYYSLVTAYKP